MPFLLLPLDFDRAPLTYAIRFRGKLLPVLGTPILFSSPVAASTPRRGGLMKPPVIEAEDIRFKQFSVHGESQDAEIAAVFSVRIGGERRRCGGAERFRPCGGITYSRTPYSRWNRIGLGRSSTTRRNESHCRLRTGALCGAIRIYG
jgi:hypothetical protein